jgi:O-6-methylguanine DNA methyltransferase
MVDPVEVADVSTPIGVFRIVYQGNHVRVLDLLEHGVPQTGVPPGAVRRKPPFAPGSPPRQLNEYFRGSRTEFAVEVDPDTASTFDLAIWKLLRRVNAGQTVTYGELARRAGFQGSARAVGGAMARNPIPIIIPSASGASAGSSTTRAPGPSDPGPPRDRATATNGPSMGHAAPAPRRRG